MIEGHYQNYIPLSDHVDVSPNGTWLAFDFWYHDVLSDIYIMTFPGTNLQQLTDFAGEDYEVAVVPPKARAVLSRFDERSQHYEVREQVKAG